MSQNQNAAESNPQIKGWKAQFDRFKTHRKSFAFIVCSLLAALVRSWLDVSKTYKGVVSTALTTWGFVLLIVINTIFILIAWYVVNRLLKYRKLVSPFPLQIQDFVVMALWALLLPMFLSMELKLTQVVPGVTELGVQDSSSNTLQSTIYNSFSRYATNLIFDHVDAKIEEEIKPIINGYGCEAGVSALSHEINRKLLQKPDLPKEERDDYISRLLRARDDTQLSPQDKAEDMARIGIEAFDLGYVKDTFDNYVCPATP